MYMYTNFFSSNNSIIPTIKTCTASHNNVIAMWLTNAQEGHETHSGLSYGPYMQLLLHVAYFTAMTTVFHS